MPLINHEISQIFTHPKGLSLELAITYAEALREIDGEVPAEICAYKAQSPFLRQLSENERILFSLLGQLEPLSLFEFTVCDLTLQRLAGLPHPDALFWMGQLICRVLMARMGLAELGAPDLIDIADLTIAQLEMLEERLWLSHRCPAWELYRRQHIEDSTGARAYMICIAIHASLPDISLPRACRQSDETRMEMSTS